MKKCNAGHEFTPENTYIYKKIGSAACRICMRLANKRWAERKKNSPSKEVKTVSSDILVRGTN